MTVLPAIPGLRAIEWLGRGGFGRVFLAEREADQRRVAVKLAFEPGDPRYAREATALARIGPPAVCQLVDRGLAPGGEPYLVLEALAGPDLASWLASSAGDLEERLRVFARVATTVDAIHAAGIVHRDLKPANAMFRADGSVALVDLGIALLPGEPAAQSNARLTATGGRIGTAAYMAPEQCIGDVAIGTRADLYSLGVILFEVVTGRVPFEGDAAEVQAAHVARRPPRVSTLMPAAVFLDEVITRSLAKDPRERFDSGAAIVAAIEAARRTGPAHPRASTPPPTARQQRSIALLGVTMDDGTAALVEAMQGHGLLVRGDALPYVVAFPDEPAPSGVATALLVGERCAARGGGCVVHVADVVVRTSARGVVLLGSALRDPTWASPAIGCTIAFTDAAAPLAATAAPPPSTPVPDATRLVVPLRGRDDLLAALASAHDGPSLTTLEGEVGVGKTRILDELARKLAERRVLRITAQPPELGDPERALRELLRATLSLAPSAPLADVVAATQTLLGSDNAWPAIALVLDAIDASDPNVAAVLSVPNRVRQEAARVIAAGLARLASGRPTVVLLDDAQWADHATLDALELATREGGATSLSVCVAALPALASRRPTWGTTARSYTRVELPPLSDDSARTLLLDLLAPVEFVPEPVVRKLLDACGGVAIHLVELVHALKRTGAVRRRPGTDAWFVAADELLETSSSPLSERIASRLLAELDPSLLALAQICSVLGDPIDAAFVRHVQDELAAHDDPTHALDANVGLDRLCRRGILMRAPGAFAARHPMLRDAIRAQTPPSLRRRVHEAAWRALASEPASGPVLARLARHAASAGRAAEAAQAFLALADDARRRHRYVDAEQDYSSALVQLSIAPDDAARESALTGRAWVRNRLERWLEAVADIRAARSLAEARGDQRAIADRWLDEATLQDFREDRAASWLAVEAAQPIVEKLGDPRLSGRWHAAAGRAHFRNERMPDAIAMLGLAADEAARARDSETRVEALLLLGPSLVAAGKLDEARMRLGEVIELCIAAGDRLHLGAAYINRMWLWETLDDVGHAVADQQSAVAIAREIGHADLERYPTHNLAELMVAHGSLDEAERLARRSRELQLRHHADQPGPEDTLLLARVLAARGSRPEARELLGWLATNIDIAALPPSMRVQMRVVELSIGDDGNDGWEALFEEARAVSLVNELFEVTYAAAIAAKRRGDPVLATWLARGREISVSSPRWAARFAALAHSTNSGGG